MQKIKKELRMATVQAASDDDNKLIVEGRAIVYDSPAVLYEFDGVQYKEVIARGALDGADIKDVPFKYNHSNQVMIMARTRSKTLQLIVDDKGLLIRAELANTTSGRDMYELVKRGDIDKMSFAFTIEEYSYNKETHTRTITKIKRVYDVSAVDTPAYPDTEISARSFFEAEAEKERRSVETENLARIKIKAKIIETIGV